MSNSSFNAAFVACDRSLFDMTNSQAEQDEKTKLVRIIAKLEAKIKAVWDKNKELNQNLELYKLDLELNEEKHAQLQTEHSELLLELSNLEAKLKEYEELENLNKEVEKSLNDDNARLQADLARTLQELQELRVKGPQDIQESLKIELNTLNRKLRAAQLDLDLVKIGPEVLAPLWGENGVQTAKFVKFLNIEIDPEYSKFKRGELLASEFAKFIEQKIRDAIPNAHEIKYQEEVDAFLNEIDGVETEFYRLLRAATFPQAKQETPPAFEDTSNTERIRVLEAKLDQASQLADELQQLKLEQTDFSAKEKEFGDKYAAMQAELIAKSEEVLKIRKKMLPQDLNSEFKQNYISQLENALKFYRKSSNLTVTKSLALDPLPVTNHVNSYWLRSKSPKNLRKIFNQLANGVSENESFMLWAQFHLLNAELETL